jgi:hypothetical protein
MTVEKFELFGPPTSPPQARVYHSSSSDPTWGVYITLVILTGNQAKVGTPLACSFPLSPIEVQAVVQLLSGKVPSTLGAPVDIVDNVLGDCPRRWKTYIIYWV